MKAPRPGNSEGKTKNKLPGGISLQKKFEVLLKN